MKLLGTFILKIILIIMIPIWGFNFGGFVWGDAFAVLCGMIGILISLIFVYFYSPGNELIEFETNLMFEKIKKDVEKKSQEPYVPDIDICLKCNGIGYETGFNGTHKGFKCEDCNNFWKTKI